MLEQMHDQAMTVLAEQGQTAAQNHMNMMAEAGRKMAALEEELTQSAAQHDTEIQALNQATFPPRLSHKNGDGLVHRRVRLWRLRIKSWQIMRKMPGCNSPIPSRR